MRRKRMPGLLLVLLLGAGICTGSGEVLQAEALPVEVVQAEASYTESAGTKKDAAGTKGGRNANKSAGDTEEENGKKQDELKGIFWFSCAGAAVLVLWMGFADEKKSLKREDAR